MASIFLLPPTVTGPVTTLSLNVLVVGCVAGATVQLYRNGNKLGNDELADYTGNATITVSSLNLKAGEKITAKQSQINGVGVLEESDPSPDMYAQIVMAIPTNLPPLLFLSNIHSCVDYIIVGGAIPGATVYINDENGNIGFELAIGTEVSVSIQSKNPLKIDGILKAYQEVSSGKSPKTPSLPVAAIPIKERVLEAPFVMPPLYECDTAVSVTGIMDGASVNLKSNVSGGGLYPFIGNAALLGTLPLKFNENLTAIQFFRRCGIESGESTQVPVLKLTHLPTPRALHPLCHGATSFTATDLVAGAKISVYIGINTGGGSTSSSLIGQATANGTTQTFPLPTTTFPTGQPADFIQISQERCSVGSLFLHNTLFSSIPGLAPPPILAEMFECSRMVEISNLTPGTTLLLTSNNADWPTLAAPMYVTSSRMQVKLYRTLKAFEEVTAELKGCNTGAISKVTRTVEALTILAAPEVMVTRLWQDFVRVKCVPGAQVHVYINEKWRGRAEAVTSVVKVPVGKLGREDKITALQTICTRISDMSFPPMQVSLGQLVAQHQPSEVIKNANPQNVSVQVFDADFKFNLPATIQMPGATFPANTVFPWLFPIGQSSPATSVHLTDYESVSLTWNLKDPPPPPPPDAPAKLTLSVTSGIGVTFKKVDWTLFIRQSLGGALTPFPGGTGNGTSAAISLPTPSPPPIFYYVSCECNFEIDKVAYKADVIIHPYSDDPAKAIIEWRGNPLQANFQLQSDFIYSSDNNGNITGKIFYYLRLINVV
ncbi:hypothetical protein [Adhaeribacter pallidiroseus]|uniref:Uncharacterized protein n=1 Tax=Adhaeribacter pallidiroseus TaxID=2072847 RepID=A0A369QJG4_9BACT|nr:hypothetical protein [Adhaeribacter pallidiroseus]RDC65051.1 hypothetical protein AHMF7616_03674 [Adhaeribacter pallidiroseus]